MPGGRDDARRRAGSRARIGHCLRRSRWRCPRAARASSCCRSASPVATPARCRARPRSRRDGRHGGEQPGRRGWRRAGVTVVPADVVLHAVPDGVPDVAAARKLAGQLKANVRRRRDDHTLRRAVTARRSGVTSPASGRVRGWRCWRTVGRRVHGRGSIRLHASRRSTRTCSTCPRFIEGGGRWRTREEILTAAAARDRGAARAGGSGAPRGGRRHRRSRSLKATASRGKRHDVGTDRAPPRRAGHRVRPPERGWVCVRRVERAGRRCRGSWRTS